MMRYAEKPTSRVSRFSLFGGPIGEEEKEPERSAYASNS